MTLRAPTPPDRLVYIDNLRVFAMLLGVLVHTTTLGDFGPIEAVTGFSDHFRMATFFAISGFFAAMLLERRDARSFLASRLQAVAVPLAASLALLNPPTLYLIHRHHGAEPLAFLDVLRLSFRLDQSAAEASGPLFWHLHLWFLFTLAAYVCVAPMLRTAIVAAPVRRSVDALLRATPAALVPLVAALLVSGACVALRAFDKAALSSFADHFIISATLGYFPYFVVGMTAFVYRTLWERMHRIDLAVFGVSIAVLGLLHTPLAGSAPQALQRAAEIFGLSMMRCAIFFALLYLFRRFITIDTKASRMLSDSVYTVYLFHFIVIYAVAVAMGVSGVDTPLVFLSVVLTTFLLTVALHRWVIEPAPLLRFLFNGRGRPLAAAPAAAAGRSQ